MRGSTQVYPGTGNWEESADLSMRAGYGLAVQYTVCVVEPGPGNRVTRASNPSIQSSKSLSGPGSAWTGRSYTVRCHVFARKTGRPCSTCSRHCAGLVCITAALDPVADQARVSARCLACATRVSTTEAKVMCLMAGKQRGRVCRQGWPYALPADGDLLCVPARNAGATGGEGFRSDEMNPPAPELPSG